MLDYSIAPLHTKIYVEIGHGYPFRIEKSFKQQIIFQRVEVSYPKCVGNDRSCARSAPWSDRYTIILSPLDELHHNEKISGEAHLIDNLKFYF